LRNWAISTAAIGSKHTSRCSWKERREQDIEDEPGKASVHLPGILNVGDWGQWAY